MGAGTTSTDAEGAPCEATVAVVNEAGTGRFVIVCEHASADMPAEFGDLGLEPTARLSHIAWDPGALGVAEALAGLLDAPLVAQRVSRLLYDCNRPPEAASAVPETSEVHAVPGNRGLSDRDRALRADRFYHPFRTRLASLLARRIAAGHQPLLVTLHSFTPVYFGEPRTVELGILHDDDARLANALLDVAEAAGRFAVRRNEPYGPRDGVTHTLREHGLANGIANVMLELRNDLIATPQAQREAAGLLASWLEEAAAAMDGEASGRRARAAGGAA